MSESYTLEAQSRTVVGKKVGRLRRQGLVPAIIYGAESQPVTVQINDRALQLTLMKAGGTHLINLMVDGNKHTVITRAVQRNIIRGEITHVDFLAVTSTTRVRADVPVHFIGASPVIETRQGILLNGIQSLSIEALPADLIDRIDVDLSALATVTDSIHVRDLKLSDRITILTDMDEMLVRITAAAGDDAATLAADAAALTSAEPEVIAKGKQEEEDF